MIRGQGELDEMTVDARESALDGNPPKPEFGDDHTEVILKLLGRIEALEVRVAELEGADDG